MTRMLSSLVITPAPPRLFSEHGVQLPQELEDFIRWRNPSQPANTSLLKAMVPLFPFPSQPGYGKHRKLVQIASRESPHELLLSRGCSQEPDLFLASAFPC